MDCDGWQEADSIETYVKGRKGERNQKDAFKLFTDQFSDGIAFFEAVTLAEQYVRYGNDVPAELWSKILQTREDYAKFKENKS